MTIVAIAGGPCTGKTTIIREMEKLGKGIIKESARKVLTTHEKFIGKNIKEIDLQEFHDEIFKDQKNVLEIIDTEKHEIVFSDRGLGDTLAYMKLNDLNIADHMDDYSRNFKYKQVFILDYLGFYKKDELRHESEEEQKKIQEHIIETYKYHGYEPIIVPAMPVEERVRFILGGLRIKNNKNP